MGWNLCEERKELEYPIFSTLEEAIDACDEEGIAFYVEKPNFRKHDKKSYADNFKWKGPE